MDEGPERIWADIDDDEHTRGSMIGRVFANDMGDIEYVRADIHAEAQATIARQQVMLDRALESNGDLMTENARLREALALYSCEDGCNDCPEHERDRVGCGWTARAALSPREGEG